MFIGNYVTIKYNSRIICQGKIVSYKLCCGNRDVCLISVDNKYFFNVNNKHIHINLSGKPCENYLNLENIRVIPFRYCNWFRNAVVYREYTINELDKEVEHLVNVLNQYSFIDTTGSCSGHGRHKLWVNLKISDFHQLHELINLFSHGSPFQEDWVLRTDKTLGRTKDTIQLRLECNHKGKRAYRCAELLANYIEIMLEVI